MRHPHEDAARLGVALRDEGLQCLAQRFVARPVALHNLSSTLVENQQVVVLVEDTGFNILILRFAQFAVLHSFRLD